MSDIVAGQNLRMPGNIPIYRVESVGDGPPCDDIGFVTSELIVRQQIEEEKASVPEGTIVVHMGVRSRVTVSGLVALEG